MCSPARTLAVMLDVGTDNEDLLNDDLYIVRSCVSRAYLAHSRSCQGYHKKRLRGKPYDEFVDKFVRLVEKHQPKCLLHFEDFVSMNPCDRLTNTDRILVGRHQCAKIVESIPVSQPEALAE